MLQNRSQSLKLCKPPSRSTQSEADLRRLFFAISPNKWVTVDLKTNGLALRPGASLQGRAFMKFPGPKALNDKLMVTAAGSDEVQSEDI